MPFDFFKRHERKKRSEQIDGSIEKTKSFGRIEGAQKVKVHSRSSSAPIDASDIKAAEESYIEENCCVARCKIDLNFERNLNGGKSGNICWDLKSTFRNSNASKHFAAFLKLRGCDNLLGFLLEVESFKACSISRKNASKSLKHAIKNNGDATSNSSKTTNKKKPVTLKTNNLNNRKVTLNKNVQELLRKHQKHKEVEEDSNSFRNSLLSSALQNLDIKTEEVKNKPKIKTKDIKESLEKGILKDAVEIFLKYISKDSPHAINVTEPTYQSVIEKICSEEAHTFVVSYFDEICENVTKRLQERHFPQHLHSTHFSRHVLDTLTTDITLSDVLQLEAGFFAFTQFLDEEGRGSLLQFWMAAHTLRKQINKCNDAEQNQEDALVLYEKYFSLQASCPLNFRKELRIRIESEICHEQGIKHTCYDDAIKHAYCSMEQVHLTQFTQSPYCMKMLQDIIDGIKRMQDVKQHGVEVQKHVNGTKEHLSSITEQNTDRSQTEHGDAVSISSSTDNEATSSMNFDLAIAEPNSLWKRPQTCGMTLGHINTLGQYVKGSQFTDEMSSVKNEKSNRLSKAVKRLVSNTAEKAEEEMAWQVANMIVNDISRQVNENQSTSERE